MAAVRSGAGPATAVRFALRELRGGLAGFYVFLACIALGVATIGGVASVTRTIGAAIDREGNAILGGDIAFTLVQRQADAAERAFLAARGRVSEIAGLRTMARLPDGSDQVLVELKAVDAAYPLYDRVALADGGALQERLAAADGIAALADEALYLRLGLEPGDTITLGSATVRLAGIIETEPDRLSDGAELGPRLMIATAALPATGLVQPGSLVEWSYRVRLAAGDAAADAVAAEARRDFPQAGWRIRTRDDASPGLRRNIDRLAQFLTLVGLAALVVGGVGVANAVRAFLESKRAVIATFKCLGAPGGFVVGVYLIQILILAALGIAAGMVLGALIPFGAAWALRDLLPIATQTGFYPQELALAALYGFLAALAFALLPLGRARDVPAAALFRNEPGSQGAWPRPLYLAFAAGAAVLLATLAVTLAHDRRIALIFVGAAIGAFVLLNGVGVGLMALARRAPLVRSTELRLALANIHRPGALTPSVVLSLGLGLTLIATLTLIDGNLRRQLTSNLPEQAPSFFFLDVRNSALDAFAGFVAEQAPEATLEHVPMLRGRVVRVDGVPVEQVTADPEVRWVLAGDRGITYADAVPEGSRLTDGEWWPSGYGGENLVSVEDEVAAGLGLEIGETVTVNVLGREITARIANLRRVEWERLAINFVLVFSPNTFAGAPHSELATLTFADGGSTQRELALMRAIGEAFPAVTAIRVKEALERVNDVLGQITFAILAASSITLATAVLVLAGALAAGHRRRLYDAVILKTLGATRRRLVAAFALEYLMLGAATAVFGLLAGAGAAWFVLEGVMNVPFAFLPGVAFGTVALALVLTVGFGLAGTWRLLGRKAAPVLRDL